MVIEPRQVVVLVAAVRWAEVSVTDSVGLSRHCVDGKSCLPNECQLYLLVTSWLKTVVPFQRLKVGVEMGT